MRPTLWTLLLLLSNLPIAAAPAPAAPTLADALRAMPAASVLDGSAVLTVAPEGVNLLPAPAAVGAGSTDSPVATPDSIAAAYGRIAAWHGHVLALAPPTMTVLNTDPALADLPLSELASQHPVPFLIGSLTEDQLRQMAAGGLAFGDLTPDQQGLLKDMLPHPFEIVPKAVQEVSINMESLQKQGMSQEEIGDKIKAANSEYEAQTKTVPEDTLSSQIRLHGFLATDFSFDSPEGAGIGVRTSDDGFQTTGAYRLARGGRTELFTTGANKVQSYLRSETPNAPKGGDLEWNRRDLARVVSLQGVKTVDELVARLARATRLELYADAHYGPEPLLVVGDLKARQPAGDVMQALGLCVCGTWRQVGPAFVLTDDVQGLGARQQFLREMVQTWSNRLTTASESVGARLRDADWMHVLRFSDGDVGALSPEQLEAIARKKQTYGHLAWKDLPAPLQAALRGQLTRHFDENNMASFERTGNTVARALKPDSEVDVGLQLRLAVSLPGTGAMTLGDPYRVQMPREAPSGAAGDTSAPANSIALDKPLRGVLCAPRSAEEARAVVARLPKMGLNALFLDVFTGGRTYFPNAALPPAPEKAGVLQAALDAAKPLHIPVYAVLDTLCWRKDGASPHPMPWPAGFAEDLTVAGEVPDQAVQRQIEAHSLRSDLDREYVMADAGTKGWVSPLDPKVRALLPALVGALAGVKGLAGLAFQDTATLGYRGLDYEYDDEGISLGYVLANRLSYLRTTHTDPIDLSAGSDSLQLFLPSEGWSIRFEVALPTFAGARDDGTAWTKYRSDGDRDLLTGCFAVARAAAPFLPLFMRERQAGVTFDPWTDPHKLNQYASLNSVDYPFRAITPQSILAIPYGPVERAHPRRFVWGVNGGGPAGDNAKRAGGEILDLITGGPPDSLPDTLDHLSAFLKKPAPAAKP